MNKDEFVSAFKTELQRLLPADAWDEKYADEIAPTYWDDLSMRADGPIECAEWEAHEWGME